MKEEERLVVRIKVSLPHIQELQIKLKSDLSFLQDVIVIPYENDCAVLLKSLAKAAAEYFDERVRPGMKIAIGGGYLIYEMISALPDKKRDIEIYPTALIGRGPDISHIDPIITATLLWAKSGRQPDSGHYVTLPPLESRDTTLKSAKRVYAKLLGQEKVRAVYEGMKKVDAVFSSIGALNADPEYKAVTQYATKNLLEEMSAKENELNGAVGDINYSFFDRNGATKPEWNPFPTLGVTDLAEMARDCEKRVVVIAGSYKMEALEGVVSGRLCNVLITDAQAVERLLAHQQAKAESK